jgi:hypothetical protein
MYTFLWLANSDYLEKWLIKDMDLQLAKEEMMYL